MSEPSLNHFGPNVRMNKPLKADFYGGTRQCRVNPAAGHGIHIFFEAAREPVTLFTTQ
jgi:hypothetical protein